jgi:hypothetical protein
MKPDRETAPGNGKKKTSGSGKWTTYASPKGSSTVEWAEVDQSLLAQAVCEITRDGDAILLGSTRDGNSLVLTVCSGDQRIKFYATSADEANSTLREVIKTAQT